MAENSRASYGRKKSSPVIDNTYGHLQPQAIDLEKVVLGALMIDKDAFSIVSEMLVPETLWLKYKKTATRKAERASRRK